LKHPRGKTDQTSPKDRNLRTVKKGKLCPKKVKKKMKKLKKVNGDGGWGKAGGGSNEIGPKKNYTPKTAFLVTPRN